jgi:hypothetical protein
MKNPPPILLLRENSAWLHYVFWLAALGMAVLAVQFMRASPIEWLKLYGTVAGTALFAFSGFVFKLRRVWVDETVRELRIESLGWKNNSVWHVAFADVRGLRILEIPTTYEDHNGTTRPSVGWAVGLVLDNKALTLNANPLTHHDQAITLAKSFQRYLSVPIADSMMDSITHLAQNGQKIEAMQLAINHLGKTLPDARDWAEKLESRK